jgi:hypothetical protein
VSARNDPAGGKQLGYVGISTTNQSLDRQLDALTRAGIPADQIYSDEKPGTADDRPGLTSLLGYLRADDTIMVYTVDLLGRDLRKVGDLVHDLAARGVRVRSLAIPSRPDEHLAFKVVGKVIGADVHLWDVNGRQRAVEAMIVHHPGGRIAVLEVSSIGPQDEAQITGHLAKSGHRRNIPGLTRVWWVQVPRDFRPRDLPLIDAALLRCEELGFDRLSRAIGQDLVIDTLLNKRVSAGAAKVGVSETAEARADVFLGFIGGFEGRGIEPLVDELAEELQTRAIRSKIDKLVATGIEERHLLLFVRQSAFSFPVYDGLALGGPVPSKPPHLPDGLSQVWLLSREPAGGVVRAIADGGWRRDYPFGERR